MDKTAELAETKTENKSIIFSEIESDQHIAEISNVVFEKLNISKDDIVVLGNMSADSATSTVAGHLIWLLRKHNLHKNEREMVLSYEESIVTVQLCLAEENKQKIGDFDVEASKVIEMHKCLVDDKLNYTKHEDNSEYIELKCRYKEYLADSNLLDCMDVLNRLKEEVDVNEALKKEIDQNNFIVFNSTANRIEHAMIEWLSGGKNYYTTTMECSLDDSHMDNGAYSIEPLTDLQEKLKMIPSKLTNTPGNMGGRSITESYAEKVLICYLHLLVNTRSESALALVLNIPERGLDHKAFTAVKREAKGKKMSMYQAIMSHVMRIRLGGKSYAPKSESPLNQFVKGLAEFTDLIHKIMNIIEEETNIRNAVRKVLNILKNVIVKSKDTNLRKQSIETVAEKFQEFANSTIENYENKPEPSPKRDPYHGGSLIGRQTLRIIQAIVDRYCSKLPGVTSHIDLLTDMFSSQATPIRFPSLMSKFRSPLEASPGSKESQSLAERMRKKVKANTKENYPQVPRYQSTMNWALPVHDVGLKNRHNVNCNSMEDYIPSKTIMHPATKSKENSIANKVIESINDKENTGVCVDHTTETTTVNNKANKRPLADSTVTQPAAKKTKKAATTKSNKKKNLPLQKGQKQLTSFFRI